MKAEKKQIEDKVFNTGKNWTPSVTKPQAPSLTTRKNNFTGSTLDDPREDSVEKSPEAARIKSIQATYPQTKNADSVNLQVHSSPGTANASDGQLRIAPNLNYEEAQ